MTLWERLLTGQDTPLDHLRLAEAHAQAGRCGAALFHFRKYLQKGTTPLLRARVKQRIQACQRQSGWLPPKPREVAHAPLVLSGAKSPTVLVPGGPVVVGSSVAERDLARGLCRLRSTRGATGSAAKRAARRCHSLHFRYERVPATVRVAGFRIQRTEVTWAAYGQCVRAGRCRQPPSRFASVAVAARPVVGVTWADARAYCRFRGGRLPTESEWVAAGRGGAVPVRVWPWGRYAVKRCASHGPAPAIKGASTGAAASAGAAAAAALAATATATNAGSRACDASPYGVLDLAGNVREWVAPDPGKRSGRLRASERLARGGSFRKPEWLARLATRWRLPATTRADDLGFRCVLPK